MIGLETVMALTAVLGVLGVGAEMLVRSSRRLLAVSVADDVHLRPAEARNRGLVVNAIWLALGLAVFHEGVWLAYLFLQ